MTTLREEFEAAQAAREEAVEAAQAAFAAVEAAVDAEDYAREDYRDSDEPRTWEFGGDGGEGHADVECSPSALDLGEIVRDGSWDVDPKSGSLALTIHARCKATDEEHSALVVLDPDEPECCGGHLDHEWSDAHRLVGGCESNPGVWSRGAGLTCKYVCVHCGLVYISTTCSQGDGAETEYDHDSVRYSAAASDGAASANKLAAYHQGDVPADVLAHREDSAVCHELMMSCLRWRAEQGDVDTSHQDAEDWWSCLDAGPPCDWDEIDGYDGPADEDPCGRTADWWRQAASDAMAIDEALEGAVGAWEAGKIDDCLEHLRDAARYESDYGDDPATTALAEQLFGADVWEAIR